MLVQQLAWTHFVIVLKIQNLWLVSSYNYQDSKEAIHSFWLIVKVCHIGG